jgi:hypothetical protein
MPKTANKFLSDWLRDNIRPMPYPLHTEMTKQYALLCETQVETAGITPRELAAAAGGNLKKHIANTLADAQDAVVKTRADKTKKPD